DQEQDCRHGGKGARDEKDKVIHPAAKISRRESENERERNGNEARQPADQKGDARTFESNVEDILAQDVRTEHMPAGPLERALVVEFRFRKRRRVALFSRAIKSAVNQTT